MRTKLVIAAVATAAAVSAVGASAYTESITGGQGSKVVGYAATTITGAAFDSFPVLHYSAGYDEITGVDVVLTGDTTSSKLFIATNLAAGAQCSDDGTFGSGKTTYNCTSLHLAVTGMNNISYGLH